MGSGAPGSGTTASGTPGSGTAASGAVAWRAPGRVNLIGEHTDYNDGLVLPFAIARSVTVTGLARADGMLELSSRQAGGGTRTLRLAALEPGAVAGWAAYPAGAAWALQEALREAGRAAPAGASLVVDSDLPQGAGLASSAALECAAAGCLAELAGAELPARELARIAWRAEAEFVGMPCGIMDQYASALCRAGHALLLDCRTGRTQDVPLDPAAAGLRLTIIDTGVRHELTQGEYAARRRECALAARGLGVASLRDVAGEAGLSGLDPVLARRARHVVTENHRVERAAAALRAGDLAACGPLLTASHRSLRDDFEVSWPQADVAVGAALGAGALGARMTGGGFGGCVLALGPAGRAEAVAAAVRAAFADAGWPVPGFLDAVPGPGAGRVP